MDSVQEISNSRKRWLTPSEQVDHMSSKGIRFDLMSREDAVSYLEKNSNYFRLRSYRTGFSKVEEGPRRGEYANLDFKMLVDMSIIDMILRNEMLILALDVEHFSKVKLLTRIERAGEDGYDVVAGYLKSRDEVHADGRVVNRTKTEISRGASSPYVSGLLGKYPDYGFPAWAFMEVISFGTFCHFYRYCAQRFDDREMLKEFYLLMATKELRNACAHNNCILNDLGPDDGNGARLGFAVSSALSRVPGMGKERRRGRMKNPRLRQIATTLYLHKELCSDGVHGHRAESLSSLASRMRKHLDYYVGTATQVESTFLFLGSVIEAWFPLPEEKKKLEREACEE